MPPCRPKGDVVCHTAGPPDCLVPSVLLHICSFVDRYLLYTHWVHGPAPDPHVAPTDQPHFLECQAPRALQTSSEERRVAQQGDRQERQYVSWWVGSRGPCLAGSLLAHMAEQRQWWLLLCPTSFPQAQPQVPESPEPPQENKPGWEAARGQDKGISQGREAKHQEPSW